MGNSKYIVEEAEKLIGMRFPVLDHGHVTLLDYSGNDNAIEDGARVSYTGGDTEERTFEQTRGLLRYLMRHRHTSPFELVTFKFHITSPIFVWRQWIRHRTCSTNEISGRYAVLPDVYYCPEEHRLQLQAESNKQGSADECVAYADQHSLQIADEQKAAREAYEGRVAAGMAKEVARINLPVSQYTSAVWQMNLHNLLHFVSLRLHPHAQYEIRVYAQVIADIVRTVCPLAWEAFYDFRVDTLTFNRDELWFMAEYKVGADNATAYAKSITDALLEVKLANKEGRPPNGANFLNLFKTRREAAEFADKLVRLYEVKE